MSATFAIGQYLVLVTPGSTQHYRFQNFYINQTGQYRGHSDYVFVPFGFSGITISRQGDNIDADLVFPNTEVSRPWALNAIKESWVARVRTVKVLDIEDHTAEPELLYAYVGQVAAGGWNETAISLRLNSVIDAVTRSIPHRVINEHLCGPLPVTSNVRV